MDPPIQMDILLNNWDACFDVFADFPGSLNLEYIVRQLKDRSAANISTVTNLNGKGSCPLLQFLGSRHCSPTVLRLLFLNGVNVNVNNAVRRSSLVSALYNHSHHPAIIKAILKEAAGVDTLRFQDKCALCLALSKKAYPSVIKMLLRAGCSPNCGDRYPPFFHALNTNNLKRRLETVKLLIDGGSSLETLSHDGRSVLCFALLYANSRQDIDFLIGLGFPTDACTVHGSPLLCAMDNADGRALPVDIAEALLDLSSNTIQGLDFLYKLSYTIRDPIEYEIDGYGMDLQSYESRFQDEYGTLLHAATYNAKCSPKLIELLVKRGVPISKKSSEEETAMHIVLKKGKDDQSIIDRLTTLLKWGCSVDAKDWAGRTPLALAVLLDLDAKILKVLLDAGARVTRQNVCDKTSVLETALDFHSQKNFRRRVETAVRIKFPNVPRSGFEFLVDHCMEIRDELEQNKWECLFILFQYSFLEKPKLNVEQLELEVKRLVDGRRDAELIKLFASKCFLELRELEQKEVGNGLTLLQLVSSPINQLPKVYANISEENNFDFDKLLRALVDTKFVKYHDMILDRVPRKLMEARLQQLRVCSMRHSPHLQIFTLNYQCVCEIAKYLSNNELMRLILAFHNCVSP